MTQMCQAKHTNTNDANLDDHVVQVAFCYAFFLQVIQNNDTEYQTT